MRAWSQPCAKVWRATLLHLRLRVILGTLDVFGKAATSYVYEQAHFRAIITRE